MKKVKVLIAVIMSLLAVMFMFGCTTSRTDDAMDGQAMDDSMGDAMDAGEAMDDSMGDAMDEDIESEIDDFEEELNDDLSDLGSEFPV